MSKRCYFSSDILILKHKGNPFLLVNDVSWGSKFALAIGLGIDGELHALTPNDVSSQELVLLGLVVEK